MEVRYGPRALECIGYSGNVSRNGIMIRTVRVFAPGTVLNLELKFSDRTFQVCGEVVWARQGPMTLLSSGRIGMGVTFVAPPEDLLSYLEGLGSPG